MTGSAKIPLHYSQSLCRFMEQTRLPYTKWKGTFIAFIWGMEAWYASRGYKVTTSIHFKRSTPLYALLQLLPKYAKPPSFCVRYTDIGIQFARFQRLVYMLWSFSQGQMLLHGCTVDSGRPFIFFIQICTLVSNLSELFAIWNCNTF